MIKKKNYICFFSILILFILVSFLFGLVIYLNPKYSPRIKNIRQYLESQGIESSVKYLNYDYGDGSKAIKFEAMPNGFSKLTEALNHSIDHENSNHITEKIHLVSCAALNAAGEQELMLNYDKNIKSYVPYEVSGEFFPLGYNPQSFEDVTEIEGIEFLENVDISAALNAPDNYKSFEQLAAPYLKKCVGVKNLELSDSAVDLEFLTALQNLETLKIAEGVMVKNCIKIKEIPALKEVYIDVEYINKDEKDALAQVIEECRDKKITFNYEYEITDKEQQELYEKFMREHKDDLQEAGMLYTDIMQAEKDNKK